MGKGRTIAGPLDPGGDYDPDDDLDIDDGLPMRNEIDPKGIRKDGDKGTKPIKVEKSIRHSANKDAGGKKKMD